MDLFRQNLRLNGLPGVKAQGTCNECTPIEEYDPNFMLDLKFFEENVYWHQTVDLARRLKRRRHQGVRVLHGVRCQHVPSP